MFALVLTDIFLDAERVPDLWDGDRCALSFEDHSFNLKWISQVFNQLVQTVCFVYPLLKHIRIMTADNLGGRGPVLGTIKRGCSIYARLVRQALIATGISVVFTMIVTALVLAEYQNDIDSSAVPSFGLAVLDNAVNLAAIYFAIDLTPSATCPQVEVTQEKSAAGSRRTPTTSDVQQSSV
ncbi:unnamed protein product [Chrysoparadoxa australica]